MALLLAGSDATGEPRRASKHREPDHGLAGQPGGRADVRTPRGSWLLLAARLRRRCWLLPVAFAAKGDVRHDHQRALCRAPPAWPCAQLPGPSRRAPGDAGRGDRAEACAGDGPMGGCLQEQLGLGTRRPPHWHEPDLDLLPAAVARRSAYVRVALALPGRPVGRQLVSVRGPSPCWRRTDFATASPSLEDRWCCSGFHQAGRCCWYQDAEYA